jgi:hypothetical protein
MSPRVARAHADELLELAAKFRPGAVIERAGEEFEERPAEVGAHKA